MNQQLSDRFQKLSTIDMHTGGEPLRIILDGYPELARLPMLQIRKLLSQDHDHLRKAVMWEPRGHADMYGLVKVKAEREDSAFGVIFMHNEGYSTMCGHATIAIGKAAIDLGWVDAQEPMTTFKIDAPCGQLEIKCEVLDGQVTNVSFKNVASFYVNTYQTIFPLYGLIEYDLAYGGAFYAYADIDQFGLHIIPSDGDKIIALGRALKAHVIKTNPDIIHPEQGDLSFLYGCIFRELSDEPNIHSRNACVFADGELDRSATGSGVSGRAAILHAKGLLPLHQSIEIQSIISSSMTVNIESVERLKGKDMIRPIVSGHAYYTGQHEFWIDPEDPFRDGFLVR